MPKLNRDPKVCARPLTKAEIKQVAQYAETHGAEATIREFNVSRTTVVRAMRIHHVRSWPLGCPPQYTQGDRDAWIKFKGSTKAAARFFGVAASTIRLEKQRRARIKPKEKKIYSYGVKKKKPEPVVTPAMVALCIKVGPQQAANSTGISTYYLTKARDKAHKINT